MDAQAFFWRMLTGQNINNQYFLKEFLGAGGFGAVYLADEVVKDRPIRELAVKLILDQDNTSQLNELITATTLDHPHLLRCFASGECELLNAKLLYLLMELAQTSLETQIESGKLSEAEVKQLISEVASALVYLHGQKITHRDLKPGNLLRVGNKWKLSDFGIVRKLQNGTVTSTKDVIGTAAYAPPEALDGQISTSWDIWSLGIIIVQALTGELPFKADTPLKLINQITNEKPDLSKVTPAFKQLVEACLQKERQNRPTAQQVLDWFSPTLQTPPSQPITQTPPQKINSAASSKPPLSKGGLGGIGGLGGDQPALKTFTFEVMTVDVVSSGLFGMNKTVNTNRRPGKAEYFTLNLPKGVTMDLVAIPGGKFFMGAPASEAESRDSERPQHWVTVPPFFLGKYQVTQAQWEAVMGNNPSYFKGPNRPVETVSWDDCDKFCKKLRQLTKKNVRLPSEAEWEYACRAGTTSPFYFGETITPDLVNYDGNYTYGSGPKGKYRRETTNVGSFPPNAFGLYGMHGNVWEWCQDNWHDNYDDAPENGAAWDDNHSHLFVRRGSSYYSGAFFCRSSYRNRGSRDNTNDRIGFRVAACFLRTS